MQLFVKQSNEEANMKTHVPVKAAVAVGMLGTAGIVLASQQPAAADHCNGNHIDSEFYKILNTNRDGFRSWWTQNSNFCVQRAIVHCWDGGNNFKTVTGNWHAAAGFGNRSVANCPASHPTATGANVQVEHQVS